jgi:hypothetical protein
MSPLHAEPSTQDSGRPSSVNRLLREPLAHFLLIGAGLFLLYNLTNGPAGDQPNRILVTPGQVEQMEAKFSKTWMREPTEEELAGLIESHVRDEVYYREAMAMGLDRNDPTIRQRMRLKLEFLLEDLGDVAEPSDEVLTAFLQEHPEKFQVEPQVSFRQVYLNPDKRQDLEADAKNVLTQLRQGAVPESVGDPTLLQDEYALAARSDIERQFGEPFARQVVALSPGVWSGPLYSGLGGHLVQVSERVEGRLPELAEVRSQVEREYLAQRRQELKDDTYQRLRAGYEVVVEPPVTVEGKPGEAVAATRPKEAGR